MPANHQSYLAAVRTHMANDRTLLSYQRTALAWGGIAAFTYKFYQSPPFILLSIVFLIVGIATSLYGIHRYRRFRARITDS
ncbi:MAG: DUF202 domain-containing protein [Spirochaetales bacterium]|nr:DUF202 domain-containing protein [Leptospiraceae bacterium]MCP5480398.1 DUF202 domain-containing protein [Spirochaetales bacterium]